VNPLEAPAVAKAAGLRYTTDTIPGIRRVKRGPTFAYLDANGKVITAADELARIRALAIPPAYADVWISPYANGHIQATGRDARGRKQYRYHKRWRATRDETKFDRMLLFAKALPTIRTAISRDLGRHGMPREKVLATVVSLLERTAIRVGNEEYARENDSYGLTTMLDKHAVVNGATIRFRFRGKSRKDHEITVKDARLAKIVKSSRDLPGQRLFEYLDDAGEPHAVHSDDVNDYLREITGGEFTAKDFRTWEGTMMCALGLAAVRAEGVTEAKRLINDTIATVAKHLGNTPAVCKKSYIYPGIVEAFLRKGAIDLVQRDVARSGTDTLNAEESAVVKLVEDIVAEETQPLDDLLAQSVTSETAKRKAAEASAKTPETKPRSKAKRSAGQMPPTAGAASRRSR
jgi:DNA topoisomerase-1